MLTIITDYSFLGTSTQISTTHITHVTHVSSVTSTNSTKFETPIKVSSKYYTNPPSSTRYSSKEPSTKITSNHYKMTSEIATTGKLTKSKSMCNKVLMISYADCIMVQSSFDISIFSPFHQYFFQICYIQQNHNQLMG